MANLWDVTDVDIDRFAAAVLDSWTGVSSGTPDAAAATAVTDAVEHKRRSVQGGTVATPLAAGGGVGTARPRASAADEGGGVDGAGPNGSAAGGGPKCIAATVAAARAVCRLPHLIGAAPVCYGIPTSVLPAERDLPHIQSERLIQLI